MLYLNRSRKCGQSHLSMTSRTLFLVSALTTPGKTTCSMAFNMMVRLDLEAGSRYSRVPEIHKKTKELKKYEKKRDISLDCRHTLTLGTLPKSVLSVVGLSECFNLDLFVQRITGPLEIYIVLNKGHRHSNLVFQTLTKSLRQMDG